MARGTAAGILPSQSLEAMIERGAIGAEGGLLPDQVQPASLDLRLGTRAYRVRASFLPGPAKTVAQRIEEYSLHEISLEPDAVLEVGCVYIVPLLESLRLPQDVAGAANPKSSVGRIDLFTRLITDHAEEFDRVPAGYEGPLYAEICPQTFPVVLRRGSRLSQLRLRRGEASQENEGALEALHNEVGLIVLEDDGETRQRLRRSAVDFTIDLVGEDENGLVGYRAKKHSGLIDIDRPRSLDPTEFWEPLYAGRSRQLILDPNEFYILASKEAVKIPPDHAAEMVPYDTQVGEFRVHYAGFFDPGFGYGRDDAPGTRAVLEVRSHRVPFILEDGQLVGRLVYERLTEAPKRLYGQDIGSNYFAQGLALSKHFKPFQG